MTTPIPNNALHTGTVGTDAKNARLAMGGLIAVQGPGAMDIRTGVMVGPGSTTLLTGTSGTAPMRIAIGPHHWVTSRGSANGPYLGVFAAAGSVDIDPAPGSGTRIDVVWEKQNDETPGIPASDPVGTTSPVYGVTKGLVGQPKQPIPLGATELGTVAVSAGATATNGANVVITNTARQTVARGADIPVRDQAERDAFAPFWPLFTVKRLDTGAIEARNVGNNAWVTVFDPAPGWATLSMAAGFAAYTPVPQYRQEGDRVFLRGWAFVSTSVGAGPMTSVAVPSSLRPTATRGLFMPWENSAGTSNGVLRMEMRTDGLIYTMRGVGANTYVNLDGLSYAIS